MSNDEKKSGIADMPLEVLKLQRLVSGKLVKIGKSLMRCGSDLNDALHRRDEALLIQAYGQLSALAIEFNLNLALLLGPGAPGILKQVDDFLAAQGKPRVFYPGGDSCAPAPTDPAKKLLS